MYSSMCGRSCSYVIAGDFSSAEGLFFSSGTNASVGAGAGEGAGAGAEASVGKV